MTKKSLISFVVFFVLQFIFSCDPCKCNPGTYEVKLEKLDVTAYNTSGFSTQLITDTIPWMALGLKIVLDVTQTRISNHVASVGSLGFSSALACDCIPDDYIYLDKIQDLKIIVRDVSTGKEALITDHFGFPGYGGANVTSLENYVSDLEPWGLIFQLDLVNGDDIPPSSIFKVVAFLDSGDTLSTETGQINFLN